MRLKRLIFGLLGTEIILVGVLTVLVLKTGNFAAPQKMEDFSTTDYVLPEKNQTESEEVIAKETFGKSSLVFVPGVVPTKSPEEEAALAELASLARGMDSSDFVERFYNLDRWQLFGHPLPQLTETGGKVLLVSQSALVPYKEAEATAEQTESTAQQTTLQTTQNEYLTGSGGISKETVSLLPSQTIKFSLQRNRFQLPYQVSFGFYKKDASMPVVRLVYLNSSQKLIRLADCKEERLDLFDDWNPIRFEATFLDDYRVLIKNSKIGSCISNYSLQDWRQSNFYFAGENALVNPINTPEYHSPAKSPYFGGSSHFSTPHFLFFGH